MIKPKVSLGSIVYFAREMSFDYFGEKLDFVILAKGEITKVYNSNEFRVRWEDDDGNTLNEDVSLKKILSFEWGGIVVKNTKRDKKFFDDKIGF